MNLATGGSAVSLVRTYRTKHSGSQSAVCLAWKCYTSQHAQDSVGEVHRIGVSAVAYE